MGGLLTGGDVRRKDLVTSLVWAAIGFYFAFEGTRLKLGTLHSPGSGFLVFWTGLTISALSIALFLGTYFKKGEEGPRILWKNVQWSKSIKLMAALFAYGLIFKWMGFLLSTFLLFLFLFKGAETRRWRVVVVSAGITAVSSFLIFGVFMEVQLPRGVLEDQMTQLYQLMIGTR
jgi:putative tricarboxylic transport membrane protein